MEGFLNSILYMVVKFKDKVKAFTIIERRKKHPDKEANESLVIIFGTYFCYYMGLIFSRNFYVVEPLYLKVIVVSIYFIPLILLVINSYMWNFDIVKEKLRLKRRVNLEIGIRALGFLIAFVNYTLIFPNLSYVIPFSVITILFISSLAILINVKVMAKSIKIEPENYDYEKIVTQKEVENVSKFIKGISYIGTILYVVSMSVFNEKWGLTNLVLKTGIFILSVNIISDKLNKNVDNMYGIKFNLNKIMGFLTLGFIGNVFVAYIFHHSYNEFNQNVFDGVKDVLMMFACACTIPLASTYNKISKRYCEIIDYSEK